MAVRCLCVPCCLKNLQKAFAVSEIISKFGLLNYKIKTRL